MKTLLQYIAFVGLPLLGVLAVLQLGSHLQAPVSVGGSWSMEVSPAEVRSAACPELPSWVLPPIMLISQSGSDLIIKLNDTRHSAFTGTLYDYIITASQESPSNPTTLVTLVVHVDRSVEPNTFEGYFEASACSIRLPVSGIRQPHTTSLTGEH